MATSHTTGFVSAASDTQDSKENKAETFQTDEDLIEDLREQLFEFGISLKQTKRMTVAELKQKLEHTRNEFSRRYSEEEAEAILEKSQNLERLATQYGVVGRKAENMSDDATRRERIKYEMTKKIAPHTSTEKLLGVVWKDANKFKNACRSLAEDGNTLLGMLNHCMKDEKLQQALRRDDLNMEDNVRGCIDRLERGECPIVVTGEISAGKSSFLNLLLEGQDFQLPQSEQETTSCICEIKYGQERSFIAHRADPRRGEETSVKIEPPTTDKLDKIVNVRYHQEVGKSLPKYKRVEIFVPLEFLECGIVLVDSPGVDSKTEMRDFVNNYLQHCVAFIYILTQAVRVKQLCSLFKIEKNTLSVGLYDEDDVEELSSKGMARSAMFVANKWDQVENEAVMSKELEKQLAQYRLATPTEEGELLKLMATRDRDHLRAGYVSQRLQALVDRFKKTAPANMNLHLRKHYRFLQHVCARVEYHTQRFLNYAHAVRAEEVHVKDERGKADRKLDHLRKQGESKCNSFAEYIKELDFTAIVQSLRQHFEKETVRNRFLNWTEEECPEKNEKISGIKRQAEQSVKERLNNLINQWENEHHMLEDKRQDIGRQVIQRLDELNADLTAVTQVLTERRPVELKQLGFDFRFLRTNRSIFGVLRDFFIDMLLIKDVVRKTNFDETNPCQSMKELSKKTLERLLGSDAYGDDNSMENLVRKLLCLEDVVDTFKKEITKVIDITREEVGDLDEKGQVDRFEDTYEPIYKQCLNIHTNLLRWELDHLFEGDMIENTDVTDTDIFLLGSGSIAGYYKGSQSVQGTWKQVTIKRYALKDDLRTIIRDYKRLRKEDSPYLGRIKGMIKLPIHPGHTYTELVVVMEGCSKSLDEFIKDPSNLGGYNPSTVLTTILPLAVDVCKGLCVLHDKRYVHGDLTAATVLLTEVPTGTNAAATVGRAATVHYRAKLYHYGVPLGFKLPKSVTTSVAPGRYSAPETVEDVACDPSMDVYSLGRILSELWYGDNDCAFTNSKAGNFMSAKAIHNTDDFCARETHMKSQPLLSPLSTIEEGSISQSLNQTRPPIQQPTEEYSDLIKKCCRVLAKRRPSVNDVKRKLEDMFQIKQDGTSI